MAINFVDASSPCGEFHSFVVSAYKAVQSKSKSIKKMKFSSALIMAFVGTSVGMVQGKCGTPVEFYLYSNPTTAKANYKANICVPFYKNQTKYVKTLTKNWTGTKKDRQYCMNTWKSILISNCKNAGYY